MVPLLLYFRWPPLASLPRPRAPLSPPPGLGPGLFVLNHVCLCLVSIDHTNRLTKKNYQWWRAITRIGRMLSNRDSPRGLPPCVRVCMYVTCELESPSCPRASLQHYFGTLFAGRMKSKVSLQCQALSHKASLLSTSAIHVVGSVLDGRVAELSRDGCVSGKT